MTQKKSLAVVIPVWNDEEGLNNVLNQISHIRLVREVIVVDDGSDNPCKPSRLGWNDKALGAELKYVRNEKQLGAGNARNRGLELVTSELVIFFDSDDKFTKEFNHLLNDLPCEGFDFCIFPHVDSRVSRSGGWGPLPEDDRLWRNAGVFGALEYLTIDKFPVLAQIAAYPWNKVYRTKFLSEKNIRCTELLVHNDIELHWLSFIYASKILVSDRVSVVHVVHPDGSRLTNRTGEERLQMFCALSAVVKAIKETDRDYLLPFMHFSMGLFHWAEGQMSSILRAKFQGYIREFIARSIDAADFEEILWADEALAHALNIRMTPCGTNSAQ